MNEKEKIKYLDFLIDKIENTEMFDIDNILTKHTKLDDDTISEIVFDLTSFGKKNALFEKIGTDSRTSWLKLTPNGEKLKNFKKGFVKYEKSLNETPLTTYQKIYLPLFILFGIISILFAYLSYSLNKKNDTLKLELNSVKLQSDFYKDSVAELKERIKEYSIITINDTIQTKTSADLKSD